VIARVWRGWTAEGDADAYERFLRTTLYPQVASLDGFRGAHILRRPAPNDEVEFVTITLFGALGDVRAFAGEAYETPVIEPEAERLLAHYDDRAAHYEDVVFPNATMEP
jgi:heme-degrading monooxygenase HmoA